MATALPEAILTSGTNALWIWNKIQLAETLDQLEQVSTDLQNDLFESEPYTQDETVMQIIRQSYLGKRKQCRRLSGKSPALDDRGNCPNRADSAGA